MNEACYNFISHDSINLRKSHICFANLNLQHEEINKELEPIIEIVCNRIESIYKSPTKISFLAITGLPKDKLSEFLQFDDVCIKLLHVESGLDIFLVLGAKLARTLLIRLLATSLITDAHGLLFSSTEKGIFSFIIARLLLDLKNALSEKMPSFKLIGIYHCQDEAIHHEQASDFGVFNFSLSFGADSYPIAMVVPPRITKTIKTPFNKSRLVNRCGHVSRKLVFSLITLNFQKDVLDHLAFGDLILFDRANQILDRGALSGRMVARWHDIALVGEISRNGNSYRFTLNSRDPFSKMEDITMEEIEISAPNGMDTFEQEKPNHNQKLMGLAKNIRVSLSIELSRLPMTLGELCEIKGGQILDLHRKIDDPLEMVVEGKVIGYCQPVQIDGRLGIRVLSVENEEEKNHA